MRSEQARWELVLGLPFAIAASLITAAIGTGIPWLIGPAIAAGPGGGVVTLVFLAISSDTNSGVEALEVEPAPPRPATAAVAEAA